MACELRNRKLKINDFFKKGLNFIFRLHNHLEVSLPEDVAKMEEEFAEVVRKRGPDFTFFQDQYGEHPEERAAKNVEVTEKLGDVQTLTTIFTKLKEKVPSHFFFFFFFFKWAIPGLFFIYFRSFSIKKKKF